MFVLAIWLVTGVAYAQETVITEGQYWENLQETETLITQALEQPGKSVIFGKIGDLWRDVEQVRLAEGTAIRIDTSWISRVLTEDVEQETLQTLQQHIRALLNFHAGGGIGVAEAGASLSALEGVLSDNRFQYAEVTPTPLPEAPDVDVEPLRVSAGLSQFFLLVAGIVMIVLAFAYFARNLQVQQVALTTDESDDPTTSAEATDLASDRAASQDYRSAIRYLYLSSLLMLNERGLLHYDSSLTNREHLRQINHHPRLLEVLRQVVNAFEDVWYGFAPVDEVFYQQFRQRIDQLRQMAL